MTRDEMILMCRKEIEDEYGDIWETIHAIADEKTSDEDSVSNIWNKK